jgi:CRP-like cAMP-binding protein
MASISSNLIPSPELKAGLEQLATIVSKPRGTILFHRGDPAVGVFLIRSGRVSLALDCPNPAYPPRILGPGSMVGLPATVSGNPYSLTAKVLDDSELAFVAREAVLECLQDNPLLCFQVMDMLSDEIADIRSALKQNGSNRRAKA